MVPMMGSTVGVADLLVATTLKPALHPGRPPGRVEVVGDEIGPCRSGQLRRCPPTEPFDEIGGLGHRLLPRRCSGVTPPASLLPPQAPIVDRGGGRVGAHSAVEFQDLPLVVLRVRVDQCKAHRVR